jgi:hypothetical protein
MATYPLWILEGSHITVSGGAQLSGLTQGDGSHLVGRSITLDSNDWLQLSITDNDAGFEDNDSSQTLNGAQTIGGTSFASGTVVEAEYRLVLSDGTSTWNVIGFNVNNSSPSYATIEGLAFVGPVGGFPPVGTPLSVIAASEGPAGLSTPYSGYASPPCFTTGTLILTLDGALPVEFLQVGDRVITRDHGAQVLRWVGSVRVSPARMAAEPAFRPIRLRRGALGPGRPERDLLLSPQHRLLIRDWRAEVLFGAEEVLATARHLVNGTTIATAYDVAEVSYFHLLFDRHEIVYAEGVEAESFLPGPGALASIPRESRDELFALFPELAAAGTPPPAPVRPTLKGWEATILA